VARKKDVEEVLEIISVTKGSIRCHLVGESPLIMHRFPKKAWEQLLFPKGRANAAELAENLKHDPLMEFRESIYRNRDPKQPAAIHMPSGAFSKGIASAALDLPGATKAQILRLVSINSTHVNIFGVPQMFMAMTRSSDVAHTPDVRTRAIFPEWACAVDVGYVSSLLKQTQVVNLFNAAGLIVGLGDWRPQKGGPYGKFRIVSEDDPDYRRITKGQGRQAQLAAFESPEPYDSDTDELFSWFLEEAKRREKTIPSVEIIAAQKTMRNGRAARV
jgi:hypothetical protein